MYVWWSLLYLIPIIDRFWEKKRSAAGNILELARRFFLIGSYIQLWYLLATVAAVLFLYLLVTRFRWNVKGIVAAAVLLYLTGVFHNTYRHVFDTVLPAANEIQWYLSVFATARNGFFFGFPFVTMGYLFRVKADRIRKSAYGWYTVFFLVLMMLEEWIITQKIGESSHDMYLMTPLVTANFSWLQPLSQWGREWERLRKQCVNSQRKFSFCTCWYISGTKRSWNAWDWMQGTIWYVIWWLLQLVF